MTSNSTDEYCFYETLNLINDEVDNINLINENFKKLSILYHPDRIETKKELSAERFFYICLAYLILQKDEYREAYNKHKKLNATDSDIELLNAAIADCSARAGKLTDLRFKDFIAVLKDEFNIISDITAQTAIGLYYEYLELKQDKNKIEILIDPEDVKPKLSLMADAAFTYLKLISALFILYFIFYAIALVRI